MGELRDIFSGRKMDSGEAPKFEDALDQAKVQEVLMYIKQNKDHLELPIDFNDPRIGLVREYKTLQLFEIINDFTKEKGEEDFFYYSAVVGVLISRGFIKEK